MSLYSDNFVNQRAIGSLTVTRTHALTHVEDEVCHYRWTYRDVSMAGEETVLEGNVSHKYSEGAAELLARCYIHISGIQNGES